MIDPALASEAVATMMGPRMTTHGDPTVTLGRIAKMWSGYIGADISTADVAQMMVLVKIARSKGGYDRDHYLDAIAYTLLAEAAAKP